MAARRPRNSLRDPVVVGWTIERDVRDRAAKIAARAGVSTSALVQAAIEHMDLTMDGLPTWMPAPEREGELPVFDV